MINSNGLIKNVYLVIFQACNPREEGLSSLLYEAASQLPYISHNLSVFISTMVMSRYILNDMKWKRRGLMEQTSLDK